VPILFVCAFAPATLQAQVSLATVVDLAQRNSSAVKLADADVQKALAELGQARDAFVPSLSVGSGLPAFPEVGFTGSLPTIWDGAVQSMVFSMPQIRYIQAAREGLRAAQLALKEAREQVALDASTAYIEIDTVNCEMSAALQQEQDAARLVAIEQQRAEGGVDPLSEMLQARLTAAQLKLKRLHLETRSATLAKQLAVLTGMPLGSITPDHSSIPEIPAVSADTIPLSTPAIDSAMAMARSRERAAKGDADHMGLLPELGFGALYNRNTTVLNSVNSYYKQPLPANNFSTGFSIRIPLFDAGLHAKARESAAEALRAKVEAEQARNQNDIQIAQLTASLRELDALADVASLKQQIADAQLKTVLTQLDVGNGASSGPNAQPQTTPKSEQLARIDERQKYEDALDASLDLAKARLSLLRALGHMDDWLHELHTK
jgi:outer membrane protein TolC